MPDSDTTTAPRPRRQPAEVRREQILDAAERVVLEQGYAATTVAGVAEAAGLAKGTVYLQFASKNDLVAALRARYLARFVDALGGASHEQDARKRLLHVVHGLFDFSVEHHALHHVLFHETGFSEEDAFASARRVLVEIIRAGVERGEFDVPDVNVAALFVLHGVHGALVAALHKGATRKQYEKVLDPLVLRALGAD